MMMLRPPLIALLAALTATGCAALDPFSREGAWRPSAVNERNLAVMVAVPQELQHGTAGLAGQDGQVATTAVERLRADRVRELPDASISRIGGGR